MTDRPTLIVDRVNYWSYPTLDELIDWSDVQPVTDPSSLKIYGVTPVEWDTLCDVLGTERKEPAQE